MYPSFLVRQNLSLFYLKNQQKYFAMTAQSANFAPD